MDRRDDRNIDNRNLRDRDNRDIRNQDRRDNDLTDRRDDRYADGRYADSRRDDGRRDDSLRDNDRHLFRLSELDDYKVASDDPDVRGWTLFDRDRQPIGRVEELIVDPDRERVRYLDVVPSATTGTDSRRDSRTDEHYLIPIGAARIDNHDDQVIVGSIDREMLSSYPVHRGDHITRDHEHEVIGRFNRLDDGSGDRRTTTTTNTTTDRANLDRNDMNRRDSGDFYNHRLYDEDQFYGTDRNRRL